MGQQLHKRSFNDWIVPSGVLPTILVSFRVAKTQWVIANDQFQEELPIGSCCASCLPETVTEQWIGVSAVPANVAYIPEQTFTLDCAVLSVHDHR